MSAIERCIRVAKRLVDDRETLPPDLEEWRDIPEQARAELAALTALAALVPGLVEALGNEICGQCGYRSWDSPAGPCMSCNKLKYRRTLAHARITEARITELEAERDRLLDPAHSCQIIKKENKL